MRQDYFSTTKMTYFTELQSASRNVSPRVLYFVIGVLLSYILMDFTLHHSGNSQCAQLVFDAARATAEKAKVDTDAENAAKEDAICGTLQGHLMAAPLDPNADAWSQMKWIGKPAQCKVKGQLIESLDVPNNFRRGLALQFVRDVEDKTHILPWLYGSKVDLNVPKRRVYLDLGANKFHTSVEWFLRMYPCDFTEVHAFEVHTGWFVVPEHGFNESGNWRPENGQAVRVNEVPGVPDWMLKRIKVYNMFVNDFDDEKTNSVNITSFMLETLNLKASDTVVVKMDIESAEWPILTRWLEVPAMADIIDELFVEIHYRHSSMVAYHWNKFRHTRDEATNLIAGLRSKGYFIHAWP